jgi:hypothetical protein
MLTWRAPLTQVDAKITCINFDYTANSATILAQVFQ